MNVLRISLACALVGWMAADLHAQWGAYGSPDPIPLPQSAPQSPGMLVAYRQPCPVESDSTGPAVMQPGPAVVQPETGNLPQPPTESGQVSSLLSQPNPATGAPSGAAIVPPSNYMGGCDGCGCGCGCCSRWYGSVDALYMTRNRPEKVYTSAEQASLVNQGYYNDVNWAWGAEATIGYRFGCCCEWGLQATYWGTTEGDSDGGPGIPGPYVSPLTFGLTDILNTTGGGGTGGDQTANNYTDGSPNHHTWRNWEAQDAELNLVRTIVGNDCDRIGIDFIAGFRWFRFQDGLVWGAERANDGSAYANDWLYLNDHVTNDLYGAQIGFNASYRFRDRWKVFVTPVVGVFDNYQTLDYNLYAVGSTTGTVYQASSQTYPNQNYPVHTTTNGFSFLTQVDLGLDWQMTDHISAQVGYRVVAVTGVALADGQIPFYANDTQAINDIQHNDSVVLHGVFAGLSFNW